MSKENLEGRAEKTLRDTDTYRVPVAIDIVAQRLNLTMSAAPLGEKFSGMLVVLGERGAIGYNHPRAVQIMLDNRTLSVRQLVWLLSSFGITRSREWVRRRRCG